jgi:uncharacterized protein (TIGR02444 family)
VESFWDFSVRTYRTPGVPDACLSLQNDHGADVNMLLYCAWIGVVSGPFDGELFRRASEFSTRWAENVVIPLRGARTWMKHTGCDSDPVSTEPCMELREEIKTVEFAAEKLQQEALESMVSVDRPGSDAPDQLLENIVANLLLYLESLDIQTASDVCEKLSIIICAAFPDIDKKAVARALANTD